MKLGRLEFVPLTQALELVAEPLQLAVRQGLFTDGVYVSAIDASLADTAAFCREYDIPLGCSANCIVVEAKRADRVWYAACLVLATDMIDVNGKVRRLLDARKASFAPQETALALSGMEYGGITPLGLPDDIPLLIADNVLKCEHVIVGGGVRGSKILADTGVLRLLPAAQVVDIIK